MGSVADMAQEESDIEMPDSDSDAFQESDIELPDGMASSCCRNDCFRDMEKNHVWAKIAMQRLHSNLEELDQDGKNRVWYAQVLNMNRTAPDGPGRRTYPWHGVVLCQKGLSQVLQCPLKKTPSLHEAGVSGPTSSTSGRTSGPHEEGRAETGGR